MIIALAAVFLIGTLVASTEVFAAGPTLTELTLRYEGTTSPVTIDVEDNKGKSIATFSDIEDEEEFIVTPDKKFKNVTFFVIDGTAIEINTSCSEPISDGLAFPDGASDPRLVVVDPTGQICDDGTEPPEPGGTGATGATGMTGADGLPGATGMTGPAGGDLSGTYPNPLISAGIIDDANISATAAIQFSKFAALTINRALVSNPAGAIVVSPVTSTELGFVSGVI